MKRSLMLMGLCLVLAMGSVAQQAASDTPASKEDVQRYLDIMHSREMTTKVMEAMLKPMHQMMHEQFLKDKSKLPADFEARMDKRLDDFLTTFPFDEVMQAMVPVYQKHFTKGDVDALVAFYSSPTGQKLLNEMPGIMAESMQTMMPILRQRLDALQQSVQQEVAQMLKDAEAKSGKKSAVISN
jgi:uncharacterized protein